MPRYRAIQSPTNAKTVTSTVRDGLFLSPIGVGAPEPRVPACPRGKASLKLVTARPKYRDVLREGGSDAKQRRRPAVDEDQHTGNWKSDRG